MVTLQDIEQGIKANFILDKKATRSLTVYACYEHQYVGIARMVFVLVALQCGFSSTVICEYLEMTWKEYKWIISNHRDLYRSGEKKYQHIQHRTLSYDKPITKDLDLRIYRKVQLMNNYIINLNRL